MTAVLAPVTSRRGQARARVRLPTAGAVRPLLRPLALFAASRVLVLLASGAGAFLASAGGRRVGDGPWPPLDSIGVGAWDGLLRWDSAWYLSVVTDGYANTALDERIAFFPLLPGLVRGVMLATGMAPTTAGLLVATVAGAVATVLIWVLGRRLAGAQAADRMAALFAFFPGSFTLSMVYAEGLLLVFALATLLALDSRRWAWAGVFAALASATRPNAVAVGAACAFAAYVAVRSERDWKALLAPALAPLGILAYFTHLYRITGDPFAWFTAQREVWGERIDPTAQFDRVGVLIDDASSPLGALNTWLPVVGIVVMVVGFVLLWRWRPGGTLVTYAVVASALVLTSATIGARPRMLLAIFPLVMALAYGVRDVWFAVLLASSAGCLGVLTVLTVASSLATP